MSSTQVGSDAATHAVEPATIPLRFEVTTLPVTDVDRAKAFYQRLGWRLDIDFKPTPDHSGDDVLPRRRGDEFGAVRRSQPKLT